MMKNTSTYGAIVAVEPKPFVEPIDMRIRAAALVQFAAVDDTMVPAIAYRTDYRAEEEWGARDLEEMLRATADDAFLRELYGDKTSKHSQSDHVRVYEDVIAISIKRPIVDTFDLDRRLHSARNHIASERDLMQNPGLWRAKMGLRSLTVPELRARAKEIGLRGYSTMRRDDLITLIAKDAVTGRTTSIEPAWLHYGDVLVLPRGEGAFRVMTDALIDAAASGRLMAGGGMSNPFSTAVVLGDAADLPEVERGRMLTAFRWHAEQVEAFDAAADELLALNYRWRKVTDVKIGESGDVVYWVEGLSYNGLVVERSWYSIDDLRRLAR